MCLSTWRTWIRELVFSCQRNYGEDSFRLREFDVNNIVDFAKRTIWTRHIDAKHYYGLCCALCVGHCAVKYQRIEYQVPLVSRIGNRVKKTVACISAIFNKTGNRDRFKIRRDRISLHRRTRYHNGRTRMCHWRSLALKL